MQTHQTLDELRNDYEAVTAMVKKHTTDPKKLSITLAVLEGRTLRDVATMVGLSVERVRQISGGTIKRAQRAESKAGGVN